MKIKYIFFLKENGVPTQNQMNKFSDTIRRECGAEVKLLGGTKTVGSLPRGPDAYVVTVCLMLCKKCGINFENGKDKIAYRRVFDPSELEDIGICEIIINK